MRSARAASSVSSATFPRFGEELNYPLNSNLDL
jgi:hypothetical protein